MRLRRSIVIGFVGAVVGAGTALATMPSGLSAELLARGTWGRQQRVRLVDAIARQGGLPSSDVAVVAATLQPGGTTGWHGHTGPSVVILETGTLRISEPTARGGCRTRELSAATGQRAFFHTDDTHIFDNVGGTVAEFTIVYFAPTGVPLLVDVPVAPAGCSAV